MRADVAAKSKPRMPKHDNAFDWSGGHPALDLVNTLDERPSTEPIENLMAYSDLVRFTELAGLIGPLTSQRLRQRSRPTCTRIAKQARELRELLHKVLAASHRHQVVSWDALRTLTEAVRRAH